MLEVKPRPNIVIFMADTLRADRLGCYGYEAHPTSPAIDAAARDGLMFERAFAAAPWTLPSHGSLFTGLSPSKHGATDVTLQLDERHTTLASRLAGLGYRTVAFTPHNAWLSQSTGLMRGFQTHLGPKHRVACDRAESAADANSPRRRALGFEGSQIAQFAEHVLAGAADDERPLFLFLHSMVNHEPYRPAAQSWAKAGVGRPDDDLLGYLQDEFKAYRANPHTVTPGHAAALSRIYDACVATVDEVFRQVTRAVERHLGWDSTILVFTSDHGQNLGEHGMFSHWLCLFDTLLHVPLIIFPRWREVPARVSRPVPQKGLFRTLLRLAGDAHVEDGGLLEMAAGRAPFPDCVTAEHDDPVTTLKQIRTYNPGYHKPELEAAKKAVRTERYKYVLHATGTEYLYDLESDPAEQHNVLRQNRKGADGLRERLLTELGGFRERAEPADAEETLDEGVLANLRALGYC
ncbi:MAG: sulfatase [Candidatus Brocadiia bacterium]